MYLREALVGEGDVDPSRPLCIGHLTLGTEAASEAAGIIADTLPVPVASYSPRNFTKPIYWSVIHPTEGQTEIFGFPPEWQEAYPTAIEVALVRAVASLPVEHHSAVLDGGAEIILGSSVGCEKFLRAARAAETPMVGCSTEFDGRANARIAVDDGRSKRIALECLVSSYNTAPLKFRFLEVYRVMEALFLADVRARLMIDFDSEPSAALSAASESLKSELRQITLLVEPQQDIFEEIWNTFDKLRSSNRFVAALFRKLQSKGSGNGGKWRTGAALIYQVRCAVVHAGEKDMIFENFADGEAAIEEVLPLVEQAALRLLGIELL